MGADELAGIRVIAVEQAVAAPLCSRHLADLGASVVKVERPGTGDFSRAYDNYVHGFSSHFVWLNRGKKSVALDLKDPAGVESLGHLLLQADVLVCNLAPGAFERIISDAELAERCPRLIRCYISGYGQHGPYHDRKAYDLLIQGEAGSVAATGVAGRPAKPGVSLADVAGGTYALAAINAALYKRERTGLGCRVDIALFDALLEWMSPLLLTELNGHPAPEPAGLHHASIAPYGPFVTADHDLVLIGVQNDAQWARLCTSVLGAPELIADSRLSSNAARVRYRELTDRSVQMVVGSLSTSAAERRLLDADVPFGRMNQVRDVVRHPQSAATGRWSPAVLPDGRPATVVTSPFHPASETGPGRRLPAVGEHTNQILRDISAGS